ncbi:MAG: tyrosine-type recombinase/integrase [Proteobacteria bacterium]|nr:tyrosine-type recombinase/integrase [Pseudomonadota bacterium]
MGFRMASPWLHPKTGVWYYRRVVPTALRPIIGKTEYRISLKTKDLKEAKRRYPDAAAKVDAALVAAEGGPVRLTNEQVHALAGEWLQRELERLKADPDEKECDLLLDQMAHAAEKGLEAANVSSELNALLQSENLVIDLDSRSRLVPRLFWNKVKLLNSLKAMAHGDYSPDATLDTLPKWKRPVPTATSSSVFISSLLDAWVTERKPIERTEYERRRFLGRLATFVGHDDATKLTKADIVRWKDALLAEDKHPKTVTNHLLHARALFEWAKNNERLAINPADGVVVAEATTKQRARLPFSDDDAKTLLSDARKRKGFRRWVPWLLAYSGARLEEVCQAMTSDVRQEKGIWYLDINLDDEGKSLKMGEDNARKIPLHQDIIGEGFLKFVEGLPKLSPLFPDAAKDRFGKRGGTATKILGRWMRDLGIADRRKVPNHSWRHRFKDLCRNAHIEKSIHDALTGHASKDEGDKYGLGYSLEVLSTAIKKLPQQCPKEK